MQRKRFLLIKKWLCFSILCFFCLVLVTGIWVRANQDEIVQKILDQLKEDGIELKMEEVKLSVWRTFPDIRATLIKPQLSLHDRSPLFQGAKVDLSLDARQLLSGQIRFESASLFDGEINLIEEKGMSNFDFPASEKRSENGHHFPCNKVNFKNIVFTWTEKSRGQDIRYEITEGQIRSKMDETVQSIKCHFDGYGEKLRLGPQLIFPTNKISWSASILSKEDHMHIDQSLVEWGAHQFHLRSSINSEQGHSDRVFQLTCQNGRIDQLTEILPAAWIESIRNYAIAGKFDLHGKFDSKGGIELNADLFHTTFSHTLIKGRATKGKGRFDLQYNRIEKRENIRLHPFTAEIGDETIELDIQLKDFGDPQLDIKIKGHVGIPLLSVSQIPQWVDTTKGKIQLIDFQVGGGIRDLNTSGEIGLHDISGSYRGIPFQVTSGSMHLDDHLLSLRPSNLEAWGRTHELSGSIDLDSDRYAFFLRSPEIDLAQVRQQWSENRKPAWRPVSEKNNVDREVSVEFRIDRLHHEKIMMEGVRGKIDYQNAQIRSRVEAGYCAGFIDATASYDEASGRVKVILHGKQVELPQLFEQWKDFGQQQIQSSHLRGRGEIQSIVQFQFLPEQSFDVESMHISGGVVIESGELIGLPMLEGFSRYIHRDDLAHIRFHRLANVFRFTKGRFELPQMFIQSNAANLLVAGSQMAQGGVEYGIKVNAGQILGNRISKMKDKDGHVRARSDGMFNKYYILNGKLDDIQYKTDRNQVFHIHERSLFVRDAIMKELHDHFQVDGRYDSPEIETGIPDFEEGTIEDREWEYLPGFE